MATNINIQGNENTQVSLILGKSYEWNDFNDQLKTLEELFTLTPEDNTDKRLQISGKINELKERIEQFKRDVLALAETFNKIEINTDRLRRAKEFFDKGEFGEARAVLETELEQMQDEQAHWLKEKEHFEKDVLPNLINNSEEFYLLAMATQADYTNPNRFEDTCEYFERSIKSSAGKDNIFQYAYFLNTHNQFNKAEKYYLQYFYDFANQLSQDERAMTLNNLANLHSDQNNFDEALKEYEEALQIRRALAETNPNTYLPDVATTLNNLAVLHSDQNNFDEALKEYEEALQIRRALAETNPNTYLPDVATTLNNLAVLHSDQNNFDEALKEYEEALQIRRALAETNPNTYLPDVATTLNNLANLHSDQNNFDEALKEYEEALQIRRALAETNPNTYLPDVAMTLNNLAVLHQVQNNFDEALKEYEEALQIRRALAETNPNTYLPDVATTLNNLAVLHQVQNNFDEALKEYEEALQIRYSFAESNPQVYKIDIAQTNYNLAILYQNELLNREKSIQCAIETITILLEVSDIVIYTQKYLEYAIDILRDWNLNDEEIESLIAEKMKETGEDKA